MAYSLPIVTMVTTGYHDYRISAVALLSPPPNKIERQSQFHYRLYDIKKYEYRLAFNRVRIKFRRKTLPLIDFKHAEDGPASPTTSEFLSWRCEKNKSLINNSRSASQDIPNTKQCQLPYSVVRPQQVTALPAPCYFNTRFSLSRQLYSYEEK